MTSIDDEQTIDVRWAQAGDQDAFSRLVRRHQDMAVSYAAALLGDFHKGQDAAQEAFVSAYINLAQLQNPAAFRSWLRLIVFKYCDRVRRKRTPSVASWNDAASHASNEGDPLSNLLEKEAADRVKAAIYALNERERTVMFLYYTAEYSYREIANLLGLAESTVKSRLYSARKHAKELVLTMVEDRLEQSRPSLDSQFLANVNALINALQVGDAGRLRLLLSNDARLSNAKVSAPFWTADIRVLHLAVLSGRQDAVRELVEAGVDVNAASDELNWRPIHLALQRPELVDYLTAHGATSDIFVEASRGDHGAVLAMLEADSNAVHAKGPDGATALHFASTLEVARALVSHGARVDTVDDFHQGTPLQWSISTGKSPVSAYLLSCGALVDLWSACALDRVGIVDALIAKSPQLATERSSDRNILRSGFHAYPLHFAARYGSVNTIRALINKGASVLSLSSDGSLAIHDAAFMGHLDAVKVLIENGAPINDRDLTYNATPLGAADHAGHIEVVEYLRSVGGLKPPRPRKPTGADA